MYLQPAHSINTYFACFHLLVYRLVFILAKAVNIVNPYRCNFTPNFTNEIIIFIFAKLENKSVTFFQTIDIIEKWRYRTYFKILNLQGTKYHFLRRSTTFFSFINAKYINFGYTIYDIFPKFELKST